MALIRIGLLDDFTAMPDKDRSQKSIRTFRALKEVKRSLQPGPVKLGASKEKRGLALRRIRLKKGFEGFLEDVWNETNEIYFLSWAWDLSGAPVEIYPLPSEAGVSIPVIPLKAGGHREFKIGEGIGLFNKRKVVSGLAVRIMVWESDEGVRETGKMLSDISRAIKKSELNHLLVAGAVAAGVPGLTAGMIERAALELTNAIGTIMQTNSDDYVDFFEGYFPAEDPWIAGPVTDKGTNCEITLKKF